MTLTATVTNADDEPVVGSIVQFSMQNAPGGGEHLEHTLVLTDNLGHAQTTLISGTLETVDDMVIRAEAPNAGTPVPYDTFKVAIGGTSGAIMIGRGTTIYSVDNDTAYRQPLTVAFADADGNPVEGASISLSAWPVKYYHGTWSEVGDEWVAEYYAAALNEDQNENVRLDAGEDDFNIANACKPAGSSIPTLVRGGNGDGLLTPANWAAGIMGPAVTTNEFGTAQVDLVYPKISAAWIETRITATATVLGAEAQAELSFILPHAVNDEGALPDSPYDDLFGLIGGVTAACP
jgi:hypothetical protein